MGLKRKLGLFLYSDPVLPAAAKDYVIIIRQLVGPTSEPSVLVNRRQGGEGDGFQQSKKRYNSLLVFYHHVQQCPIHHIRIKRWLLWKRNRCGIGIKGYLAEFSERGLTTRCRVGTAGGRRATSSVEGGVAYSQPRLCLDSCGTLAPSSPALLVFFVCGPAGGFIADLLHFVLARMNHMCLPTYVCSTADVHRPVDRRVITDAFLIRELCTPFFFGKTADRSLTRLFSLSPGLDPRFCLLRILDSPRGVVSVSVFVIKEVGCSALFTAARIRAARRVLRRREWRQSRPGTAQLESEPHLSPLCPVMHRRNAWPPSASLISARRAARERWLQGVSPGPLRASSASITLGAAVGEVGQGGRKRAGGRVKIARVRCGTAAVPPSLCYVLPSPCPAPPFSVLLRSPLPSALSSPSSLPYQITC
ncbi:hypothetical protein K438DRAFT_1765283 [Mycena galopus ATCC 62051]|nr:hypothetical protein K438DRAFT_1765283 [Mycena galopus ATCC 62051]